MKNWIEKNYKTLIIAAFLVPIITVAIVSISHVTQWYGISNPVSWSVYLSIGIEIAALSALAEISANMGSKVYFPFAIVTLVQFIGNIFFAYSYIDINAKMFRDWVDLMSPFVEFMGIEPTDFVGHKRFLAFFAGGMLPIISLSFLHMLVKFSEEDRKKIIETPNEENKIDASDLVAEVSKVRLSENDLKKLEEILLNPPSPNEELIRAAEKYKEKTEEDILKQAEEIKQKRESQESTINENIVETDDKERQREALIRMMEYDQKLGLYDEPFDNPLIKESEDNDWGGLTNEELIGDDEIPNIDVTLVEESEDINDFEQESEVFSTIEPTEEEEESNFSTIEPQTENIFQNEMVGEISEVLSETIETPTEEFEIPEQEGWTEELEQQYWEEQVPEPLSTPEELSTPIESIIEVPQIENTPTEVVSIEDTTEKKNS